MKLALCILLAAGNLFGATYYVATNGNNAADGSVSTPWSNVWYAATAAEAGDTVIIGDGEFNEYVTNTASGAEGSPIVFTGTRGPVGAWLTIIDPSVQVSNGWSEAAEIGAGVYKLTNSFASISEMTLGDRRLARLYSLGTYSNYLNVYANGDDYSLEKGTNWLLLETNLSMTIGDGSVGSWDGIEAMWGADGSTIYFRQRDGSSPNGLDLRTCNTLPAWNVNGKSHIVISNLHIQGASIGVTLAGSSCEYNHVASNSIINGYARVCLSDNAHNNTIYGNRMTPEYYGYTNMGPYTAGSDEVHIMRYLIYSLAKYVIFNQSSTWDFGVDADDGVYSNTISFNQITNGMGHGISLGSLVTDNPLSNNVVESNLIRGMCSMGVLCSENQVGTVIRDNLFENNNIQIRFHHFGDDTLLRTVWIYRNRFWLEDDCGEHILCHCHTTETPDYAWPAFYVYHNSFSGGAYGIADNGYLSKGGQLTNSIFVNNVFSDAKYFYSTTAAWIAATNVGVFDYNIVTPPFPTYPNTNNPLWFGSNNIKLDDAMWVNADGMSFKLPTGSAGNSAALDTSGTWTSGGVQYGALPDSATKIGSGWDIGALESDRIAKGKTVKAGSITRP